MQTSESIERTTIGIDVSDKYSRVCVLDSSGAVVALAPTLGHRRDVRTAAPICDVGERGGACLSTSTIPFPTAQSGRLRWSA